MPILTCTRIRYYSHGDETAFFDWVGRISCVVKCEGIGEHLYLHVRSTRVSDDNLRDLIALFYRYRVSMEQLAQFESPRNRRWFRSPEKFWYRRVWKSGLRGKTRMPRKP